MKICQRQEEMCIQTLIVTERQMKGSLYPVSILYDSLIKVTKKGGASDLSGNLTDLVLASCKPQFSITGTQQRY